MKRLFTALAAAAAMGLQPAAQAEATLASITVENDFFAGYDHHYTNGVQLAFVATPSTVFADRPISHVHAHEHRYGHA